MPSSSFPTPVPRPARGRGRADADAPSAAAPVLRHRPRSQGGIDIFRDMTIHGYDMACEIDAFVAAMEKGAVPEVGFEAGRLAPVLAEAALRSVAEAGAVHVNEIG